MGAHEHLSPQQFSSYYRGMRLGEGAPPAEDADVLARLRTRDEPWQAEHENRQHWPLYGQHWSSDRDTAEDFATQRNHGNYAGRQMERGERWGVVVEAHATGPHEPSALGAGHGVEQEVRFPHRGNVAEVLAHVYHHPGGAAYRGRRHVRSFEIPEEHWRNA